MQNKEKIIPFDLAEARKQLSQSLIGEILDVLEIEDKGQRKVRVALWLDKLERNRERLTRP